MARIAIAAAIVSAGCTVGCGTMAVATTLSMNVASWPADPSGGAAFSGDQLLRARADRPVDVERYDPVSQRWALVCTTPCEQTVPRYGTYRVSVGDTPPSEPFGWTSGLDSWIVLRIDPDGKVWTRDSPSLRAWRSAEARKAASLASAAWMMTFP